MDTTISVSKGCFVFKNGATSATKSGRKTAKTKKTPTPLLGKEITEQPFYKIYQATWKTFETDIENLQRSSYSKTLNHLVEYIEKAYSNEICFDGILPAAALLTGINQPDHHGEFEALSQRIHEDLGFDVCILQSRDCPNIKTAIEMMVHNLVEDKLENEEETNPKQLKRSQCTMQVLSAWYRQTDTKKTVVVILPDFECFKVQVLEDLILILSTYCSKVQIVLVLGVATAFSALHNVLPHHVMCKIKLEIFQTQPAPIGLNEVQEKVILSPKHSFHMSGKVFKFLTHIFLYYDFSINGFIQGFKYCLMEHFVRGNAYALCTDYTSSLKAIKSLTHEDIETIRHLMSFRPYVESLQDCKKVIAALTDDAYLKKELPHLLLGCHLYFIYFRTFLEFFTILVEDLPQCLLGKFQREIYATCMSKDVVETDEFIKCWQMISFMSKDELVAKISRAIKCTTNFVETEVDDLDLAAKCRPTITEALSSVLELLTKVVMAGVGANAKSVGNNNTGENQTYRNRHDLKEKLLEISKREKPVSDFAKSVNTILEHIKTEIIEKYLKPLSKAPPLHELFVYTDLSTIRRNIIGTPRAALHTALNNPHYYLQCKCCELKQTESILPTFPDLSVAYKLHLESGRMINLFDWLQAFRSIVDSTDDDAEQVDPKIQARFTRAVAELQFLGYIKTSKRKADHVTRLTW